MADHLSRLVNLKDSVPLKDSFPNEHLLAQGDLVPWYVDLVNYLVTQKMALA